MGISERENPWNKPRPLWTSAPELDGEQLNETTGENGCKNPHSPRSDLD